MIKKNKLTSYLILTLLVVSSGSVLNVLGIDEIIMSLLFVSMFVIAVKSESFRNKKHGFTLLWLIFITLVLFALQAVDAGKPSFFFGVSNIRFVLLLATCCLVCFYFYYKPNFVLYLNSILLVFTIHAVVSAVIISVFPTENTLFSTLDGGSKYVGYLYLFFQRIHVDWWGDLEPTYISYFGFQLQRAHGLAWEPGNFATYVNIFIFINLFIYNKTRYVALGVLAIVVAWSTAGMIVMLGQFIYYFFSKRKKISSRFIVPQIIIGALLLSWLAMATINNFDDKINGEKSGSGASRFLNTVVALKVIVENPLIGTGFNFERYSNELDKSFSSSQSQISAYVDSERLREAASTSSFLRLFSQFGIPIGLILTIALFKQTLITKNKKLFAVIIILSVSSAPLMFTPFYFLFVSSGVLNMMGIKPLIL
jgi:hypothetical protein